MDHCDDDEEGTEREFKDDEGREDAGEGVAKRDGGDDVERDGEGRGGVLRKNWGETGKSKTEERGGEELHEKDRFSPTVGEKREVEVKKRR